MKQSNAFPIALIAAGLAGALWCLKTAVDLFLAGDLAGKEPVLAFACFSVLACVGWQELRSTNDFNESE